MFAKSIHQDFKDCNKVIINVNCTRHYNEVYIVHVIIHVNTSTQYAANKQYPNLETLTYVFYFRQLLVVIFNVCFVIFVNSLKRMVMTELLITCCMCVVTNHQVAMSVSLTLPMRFPDIKLRHYHSRSVASCSAHCQPHPGFYNNNNNNALTISSFPAIMVIVACGRCHKES